MTFSTCSDDGENSHLVSRAITGTPPIRFTLVHYAAGRRRRPSQIPGISCTAAGTYTDCIMDRQAERVRGDILRLCHGGLDSRRLRIEVIRQLRRVVPIDASFFATTDPATV